MAKNISLKKTTYIKEDYDKVVNREFTFFVEESTEQVVTVEEFFNLYEDLYLEIPIEGDINSHEYLASKSGELANLERNTEEIQPLLDEIAQLREQLLNANRQIVELQSNIASNV